MLCIDNVAEEKYGTQAWEASVIFTLDFRLLMEYRHWAKLNNDEELTWGRRLSSALAFNICSMSNSGSRTHRLGKRSSGDGEQGLERGASSRNYAAGKILLQPHDARNPDQRHYVQRRLERPGRRP
jgi:hypothetical protein